MQQKFVTLKGVICVFQVLSTTSWNAILNTCMYLQSRWKYSCSKWRLSHVHCCLKALYFFTQRNMEKTSINDAAAELALQLVQQAQTLGPTGDNAVLMSQDPATALAHAAHLQQQRREIWQGEWWISAILTLKLEYSWRTTTMMYILIM